MKNIITSENWHVWESPTIANKSNILASDPNGKLCEFESLADAVNNLFLTGFKVSARELNAKFKEV